MDGKSVGTISVHEPSHWKVYVDGAANQKGSNVRLVLISPEKIIIEKSLRLGFSVVEVFSDSRLVMGQVKGELKARDVRM